MLGINAELATEFAKDKVYEESKEVFRNQAYIFGKQWFKITRVENKVDVLITDSPLLLSVFYNDDNRLGQEFNTLILKVFNQYDSLNYLILRHKPYNSSGRFQTEEESNELEIPMKKLLEDNKILYEKRNGNQVGYDMIIHEILKRLGVK
jgi:hypothetical protein